MLPAIGCLTVRAAAPEEWGGVVRVEVVSARYLINNHGSMQLPQSRSGDGGRGVIVVAKR